MQFPHKIFYYESEDDRKDPRYKMKYKIIRGRSEDQAIDKFKQKFPDLIFAFIGL